MSVRETSTIRAALGDKGFHRVEKHHEMWWYYVGERKTSVRTRISHGTNEYGDSLLGQMARQLRLGKADLLDLIDCPMTKKAYLEVLTKSGSVTP